ncbi:hypothetical protein KOR42_51990 [Thalassoglobus neptunius]|uniref:DUF1028 domain-containing protein n=1 Tax=Thalassoglobus neptunius TaxID=1938619 RepID=A0A5C5V960_9PLAN|nr:DUF1028 domain-containing protein [Thalassoglobus neptunius]TWT35104.1 hypothetical protein KOR42_51990 [Thalassoglobus neptunius]
MNVVGRISALCALLCLISYSQAAEPTLPTSDKDRPQVVATFSIVAYDPEEEAWAIGVASKFLAVGHVVPWAEAETGAIATQSLANTSYGPNGLALLREGKSAAEVLEILVEADEQKQNRQVGIVDRFGNAATFTGEECLPWCGGKTGDHYACQGNILAGPEVIENMAAAFEKSEKPLAWRVMEALQAADQSGGDIRGRQSAAILVVKDGAGYGGFNDRMIDLRVDDHATPIQELARILQLKLEPSEKVQSEETQPEETQQEDAPEESADQDSN